MENIQEQLMATSEEFRRLSSEHSSYAKQLDELASHPYLSEQEQLEEIRLKKLKLRLKDEMQEMMHHASPSGVS